VQSQVAKLTEIVRSLQKTQEVLTGGRLVLAVVVAVMGAGATTWWLATRARLGRAGQRDAGDAPS
jgi:hypothetical protein